MSYLRQCALGSVVLLAVVSLAVPVSLTGCKREEEPESTLEEVQEQAEEAQEQMEDTAEKMGEEAEEAVEQAEETVQEQTGQ